MWRGLSLFEAGQNQRSTGRVAVWCRDPSFTGFVALPSTGTCQPVGKDRTQTAFFLKAEPRGCTDHFHSCWSWT